jgi:hypothetical protein
MGCELRLMHRGLVPKEKSRIFGFISKIYANEN